MGGSNATLGGASGTLAGLRLADGSHLTSTTTDAASAVVAMRLGADLNNAQAHQHAALPPVQGYALPPPPPHQLQQQLALQAASPNVGYIGTPAQSPQYPQAYTGQAGHSGHSTQQPSRSGQRVSAFGQPASGYSGANTTPPVNNTPAVSEQVDSQGGFILDERNSDRLFQRSGECFVFVFIPISCLNKSFYPSEI